MWLLKKIYLDTAKHSKETAIYRIGCTFYQVSLDWDGIKKKLEAETGNDKPLVGGLSNGTTPFSFGGYWETMNILVIKADHYAKTVMKPRWMKSWPFTAIVAYLLAHEIRHVMQKEHDYGWKTPLLVPLFLAKVYSFRYRFLQPLFLTIQLLLPLPAIFYFFLTFALYHFDWREEDAVRYARTHWHEWVEFVKVTELQP